jgi:hypothetical protein
MHEDPADKPGVFVNTPDRMELRAPVGRP